MTRHSGSLYFDLFGKQVDLEIAFDFRHGAKATGPSWADAGDPGYPPEIEIVSVRIYACDEITCARAELLDAAPPAWFVERVRDWIRKDEDQFEKLVDQAEELEAA